MIEKDAFHGKTKSYSNLFIVVEIAPENLSQTTGKCDVVFKNRKVFCAAEYLKQSDGWL